MTKTNRWSPLFSSFWTIQAIGWGMYGLLWYLASVPVYERIDAPGYVGVLRALYYVGIGAGITIALRYLYRRLWNREVSLTILLPLSLACSLVGSAVWLFFFEGVKWPLDSVPFSGAYGAPDLWYFARPVVSNTIVLMAWSALYFGIKYHSNLLTQQERTLRAETLAREAQIQMLRYQLNPHFLFNTLNTLLTLIGEDDRRAKQFVHELAGFLRYSLMDADTHTVSLREELEVVRSFLSIERLRYEDDLQVDFEVDSATESMQVPPFLVQSLVENAVKHGRATGPVPVQVRLITKKDRSALRIDVANTGRLLSTARPGSKHGGVGLKNVRLRLRKLYADRHTFSLEEADGWVRAQVLIQYPENEQTRRSPSGESDGREYTRSDPTSEATVQPSHGDTAQTSSGDPFLRLPSSRP